MKPHQLHRTDTDPNARITVAAVGLLAMCLVTFDHEALGHGGTCLALGGHITLLTSSLFTCDLKSIWIAAAGPAVNVLVGTVALILTGFVPRERPAFKLLLILVTAFSYFWESGYLVQAMIEKKGDLFYVLRDMIGELSVLDRIGVAAVGVVGYVATLAATRKALAGLGFAARATHEMARTAWLTATVGSLLAASLCSHGWGNIRDVATEFGLAACPLLFISFPSFDSDAPAFAIGRNRLLVGLSIVAFGVFAVTLGRGFG